MNKPSYYKEINLVYKDRVNSMIYKELKQDCNSSGSIVLLRERIKRNGTELNKQFQKSRNTSRAQGPGVVPGKRSFLRRNEQNGTND